MSDISFPPVSPWANPAVVDRLKEIWPTHSASQIVHQLFNEFRVIVTRSGVVGKLHRLGIGIEAKTNVHPLTNHRNPSVKRPRAEPAFRPRIRHESPEIKAMRCAEIVPLNVSLFDLEHGQCKFPYGDGPEFSFCGHAAAKDRPYCVAHLALTTKPTKGVSA